MLQQKSKRITGELTQTAETPHAIPCCLIKKCYRAKDRGSKRCLIKDVTEAG